MWALSVATLSYGTRSLSFRNAKFICLRCSSTLLEKSLGWVLWVSAPRLGTVSPCFGLRFLTPSGLPLWALLTVWCTLFRVHRGRLISELCHLRWVPKMRWQDCPGRANWSHSSSYRTQRDKSCSMCFVITGSQHNLRQRVFLLKTAFSKNSPEVKHALERTQYLF